MSDRQERFSRLLDSLEIEYKEIKYDHPLAVEYPCIQKESKLLRETNNLEKKRWLCLDIKAFKNVIMSLQTENGNMVRRYYINLEEAMFAYGEYTHRFLVDKMQREARLRDLELSEAMTQLTIKESQLAIKDREEEELKEQLEQEKERAEQEKERAEQAAKEKDEMERYSNKLRDIVTVMKSKQPDQVIYIATTKAYAKQNRFKVGGVKSRSLLKGRLSTYNTGRPVGDKMYYAYISDTTDYNHLEQRIKKIIGDHIDNNEMYNLHYDSLEPLIEYLSDRFDEEVKRHKALFESLIKDTISKTPRVPEPILLNGSEYRRIRNGQVVSVQKMDLDAMSGEEKMAFVKSVFEEFSVLKGEHALDRKEFEAYLVEQHKAKFNKRALWSVTKMVADKMKKKIQY
ncbi:hypothetical protein DH26_gp111 [Chloriridovirus anopheles1]|uniref:MSV199 domain-containing protein n=1 Tax=Chloriridovirus anopheles1 TaxID=1465751 RepID=W8QRI3_9VIRU|nr:hypothetical protein DH26_gp111 [Anopheles minimus iridovirus]AHL67602.1 hypothetical protein AMIV_111 [Anopheles minimus iridovirus]